MSKVISFLESIGTDAMLRHVGKDDLAIALNQAQIEPALKTAILAEDHHAIEALLECKSNVCCGIFPGKEEEDESEEEPSKDDEEVRGRSSRAA